MYKKKIIGIALIAAMVSSMTAVSVSARDSFDAGEIDTYVENHSFGIVGTMTDWGESPDVPMTDPDGDGVFVGVYKDLPAGEHAFKVRADSSWDDSWGVWEYEYERTMNSQTNCEIGIGETVDIPVDLIVTLDTNGDDEVLWPVNFYATGLELEATKYGLVGSMTGWADGADVPMYEYDDGKYVGIFKDLAAGDYEFKIRADGKWDESYGAYEDEYDRTNNSQTNIAVSLEDASDIVVFFDTTGDDNEIWPVSYTVIDGDNTVVESVYTGKEKDGEEPSEEPSEEPVLEPSKYGIVGSMTNWADGADLPMYETEPGIFQGVIYNQIDLENIDLENLDLTSLTSMFLEPGEYEFKVRADGAWDESYGVYEPEYDRTNNSQTNIKITTPEAGIIVVKLDTTGDDDQIWPISYAFLPVTADPDITPEDLDWVYTGKPVDETEEPSQEPDPEPSTVTPVEESSTPATPEYYETQITDYIYFDNSETKWEEVYAYWWDSDYARTYDLENNDWGIEKIVNEDGTEGWQPVAFPGTKMEKIEGTDIWQARIPFGAQKIIFNSGKTDAQIKEGEIGYQTADLSFDAVANAGQVYVVDATPTGDNPNARDANPTPGRGIEKTKYKYNVGEWKVYEGAYNAEQLGEKPAPIEDNSTVVPVDGNTDNNNTDNNTNNNGGNNNAGNNGNGNNNNTNNNTTTPVDNNGKGNSVNTGDTTMPIAVGVVAVAALGVALVASKKKSAQD